MQQTVELFGVQYGTTFKQTHDEILKNVDLCSNSDIISELISKLLKEQSKMLKKLSGEKFFDESVLSEGGATHFKLNGKWYAVSVLSLEDLAAFEDEELVCEDIPPKYKFHIRNAFGDYVFVKARDYKDAQDVIDAMFGKGRYKVSASNV